MATMARDFFVRTDDALGDALERQAATEGRSVSNLIRLAISKYLRDAGIAIDAPEQPSRQSESKAPSARKPRGKG